MVDAGVEPEKTIVEIVKMRSDGRLEISTTTITVGGPRPCITGWIAEPGDPDFTEFSSRHKVTKIGETSTITKKLINGEWIQE